MELSKTAKIWIGIGTAAAIVLPLILAVAVVAVAFVPMLSVMTESIEGVLTSFALTFGLVCFMLPVMLTLAVLTIGLQIFYLIHILKNEQIEDNLRLIAGLGLVFLPFIAQPVYYLLFIWPDSPPALMLKATNDRQWS